MGAYVAYPLLVAVALADPSPRQAWAWVPVGIVLAFVVPLATGKVAPRPYSVGLVDSLDGRHDERVLLRRCRRRDVAARLATVDDEVVITNGWPEGLREESGRLLRVPGNWRLVDEVLITDRRTRSVVGVLSVEAIDEDARSCELGWWVGPGARRQGYGTAAVQLALQALHGAGIHQVRIGTSRDNVAVQRVLERVGARPLPSRSHVLPNGTTIDALWFAHYTPSIPAAGP